MRHTPLIVTLSVIVLAAAPNYGWHEPPVTQVPAPVKEVITLEQGWTSGERQTFYHKSEGTLFIPYSWFLALEQAGSPKLFLNAEDKFALITQLGLIPDTDDPQANPDRLPVGFTKSPHPIDQRAYLGFNCAFCHTGQIYYTDSNTYKRYTIRIEGGASMQFNARFIKEVVSALVATLHDPEKFQRFVQRVQLHEVPPGPASSHTAVAGDVMKFLGEVSRQALLDPIEWGFGRFDALGNGGNTIFRSIHDNIRVANAPVSVPSIWNTTRYEWMQWNGSIQNFLARGIAEAISVHAPFLINLGPAGADPTQGPPIQFLGNLQQFVADLEAMGAQVKKLTGPSWPADIFPPIDSYKRDIGKTIYGNKCEYCHVLAERPTGLMVRASQVDEIGTDPLAALNYLRRVVETGALGQGRLSAAQATQYVTSEIMKKAGKDPGIPNVWQAPLSYTARPLTGIWATPPYLHNGAVPNLFQLLLPATARDTCFYVDGRAYDPVLVGFVTRRCDGQSRLDDPASGFEFDTTRLGNANGGHEFIDTPECKQIEASRKAKNGVLGCALTFYERWAVVEYLKTL